MIQDNLCNVPKSVVSDCYVDGIITFISDIIVSAGDMSFGVEKYN